MKKIILLWLTLTMLTCLSLVSFSVAAEFEGDVVESRGVDIFKGRIWVKDGVYRLEMDRPGGLGTYIIVGAKPGMTQVVLPKYKVYMELSSNDMLSQMNDPFQAAKGNAKRFKVKNEGKEIIEGLECERQLVHSDGQKIMLEWFSPKLDFYIKAEQLLQDDWYVLVHNIRQVPVQASRLKVPAGYALKTYDAISKLVEADPEAAAEIAAYKKTRPRKSEIVNSLSSGDTWNLILTPGMKIRVKVKNGSESDSWFAIPYKGQTPLKSKSECTYHGNGNIKIDPELGADGIRMGVIHGKYLGIRVILIGKMPHVQASRRVFYRAKMSSSGWMVTPPFRSYEVRIYSVAKSAAGVRFTAEGKTQKLKIPAGQSRNFSFGAKDKLKDLDITVDSGKVKVVCMKDNRAQAVSHVLLDDQTEDAAEAAPIAAPSQAVRVSRERTSQSAASKTAAPGAQRSSTKSTDVARTVLVLDASGSMWGRIQGKPKIEIAKEVLTDLVNDLPEKSYAGLVAYGHRSKGDCRDVEELVPLQPLNRKLLVAKIKAISPKGKTPITLSIRKTAEKLKGVEEDTTIILVSDGKETCEGDPCALVKELKAAGIRFTMYVIGFDVTEEEKAQLECMARAGDGQYFTAKTAQEFRVAANQAVKESQNFGYLKITALRNGKPILARVDIFPQGQKQTVTSTRAVTDPNWPGSKLKPGVYDLTVTDEKMKPSQRVTFARVTVTAGRTTEKTVDFSGGSLKVAVLANGKKETASLYVYPAGKNQILQTGDTSRDNPKTFVLAPGIYDLRVLYKKSKPATERRFNGIEVKAGQAIAKQVEFGEGRLSIEVLVNGSKGSAGLYVFEAGKNKRITTGDTSRDNPKIFKLNAGNYDMKVVYRKAIPATERILENIEVVQGKTVEKRVEYQEGILEIQATSGGKATRGGLSFFRPGESKRLATGNAGKPIRMQPGRYEVVVKAYKLKGKPEKRIPFAIQAGHTTALGVDF
jgi:Ca-activated chloride channel homolog